MTKTPLYFQCSGQLAYLCEEKPDTAFVLRPRDRFKVPWEDYISRISDLMEKKGDTLMNVRGDNLIQNSVSLVLGCSSKQSKGI